MPLAACRLPRAAWRVGRVGRGGVLPPRAQLPLQSVLVRGMLVPWTGRRALAAPAVKWLHWSSASAMSMPASKGRAIIVTVCFQGFAAQKRVRAQARVLRRLQPLPPGLCCVFARVVLKRERGVARTGATRRG